MSEANKGYFTEANSADVVISRIADTTDARLASLIVGKFGFKAHIAENGCEVISRLLTGQRYEAVLMDTDVNEGTEVRDIGHGSLENHPGLQVLQGLDPVE